MNGANNCQPGAAAWISSPEIEPCQCNTVIECQPSREEPSPGDYAAVAVRDTGTTIPSDGLRFVFEPLFTTKDHAKGTGLGLSQVFRFVKESKSGLREALSGKEALRTLKRDHRIEVVLVDFALPDMHGLELSETIRAIRPVVSVIFS